MPQELRFSGQNRIKGDFPMSGQQAVTFQEALDIVESLPEYQQEDLIHIIQRRRLERSRELLAERITEARAEYARGEVTRGTVDDLMKELTE
jgi:hypothetical protein